MLRRLNETCLFKSPSPSFLPSFYPSIRESLLLSVNPREGSPDLMKRRLNRDTPYRMKAPHKFSFEKNRRFDIPDARVRKKGPGDFACIVTCLYYFPE